MTGSADGQNATQVWTGGLPLPDTVTVQLTVARHVEEEGCQCAAPILARYAGVEAS